MTVSPKARNGILFAVVIAAAFVASRLLDSVGTFPESWNVGLAEPVDNARSWLINNQRTHWLYQVFLNPIADSIDKSIDLLHSSLAWLPWYSLLLAAGIAMWWTRGRVAGLLAIAGVAFFGIVEVWDEGLETLALMVVAVIIANLIGIPLGILMSRNDRAQGVGRVVLDTMQTMPGFVYLIPFVLLFGIGLVPALVATLIFALPPAVRATDLGIRNLPAGVLEAGDMFGATERQGLTKVRLPLARPAILVGVNQSINLAISMVVIAALIGAGGLGNLVLRSLRDLSVGEAAEAGLAIVVMAILFDRFTGGLADPASRYDVRWVSIAALMLIPITLVGGILGHTAFPSEITFHFSGAIDSAVEWAQINLFEIGNTGIGTGPFNDFVTIKFITPLRELLSEDVAWPILIGLAAIFGYAVKGWRLALWSVVTLTAIGLLGMWELSMDTLAQSIVAVAMTLMIGIPIGVLTSRSDRVRAVMRPFLDFLQTVPSFVLLVPILFLFRPGRVPGILASVIYALPVAVYYTDLGLRGVTVSAREAASSFGATSRQRLFKVELPLAGPQIMTAVNQTIMLVLAMVVIAGLVGGGGLGLETVRALRRSDSTGRGFEAGIAIVLLAAFLDRSTRAIADRMQPPAEKQ